MLQTKINPEIKLIMVTYYQTICKPESQNLKHQLAGQVSYKKTIFKDCLIKMSAALMWRMLICPVTVHLTYDHKCWIGTLSKQRMIRENWDIITCFIIYPTSPGFDQYL